ncbi:hypothetical protein DUI87_10878 [Hirundo rustica rustica]|uniref:Uncharacterized protein n=1 Tax=Hirundo rustica rustica TaxID=333673 RepID=A0A3M0KJT5_HIRRU|nr:hypothetical protein DUI87_10878 [Hirundo rustica rustica]
MGHGGGGARTLGLRLSIGEDLKAEPDIRIKAELSKQAKRVETLPSAASSLMGKATLTLSSVVEIAQRQALQ